LRLTLTADRYKTERGEQVLFDSTYKINAAKSPAQIDMIGTEGELTGKAALGILKLDGDSLTMCYVMPGKDRPAAFESVIQRPCCNRSGSGIRQESTSGQACQPARVQPFRHSGRDQTESGSGICGIARRDTTWRQLWTMAKYA